MSIHPDATEEEKEAHRKAMDWTKGAHSKPQPATPTEPKEKDKSS